MRWTRHLQTDGVRKDPSNSRSAPVKAPNREIMAVDIKSKGKGERVFLISAYAPLSGNKNRKGQDDFWEDMDRLMLKKPWGTRDFNADVASTNTGGYEEIPGDKGLREETKRESNFCPSVKGRTCVTPRHTLNRKSHPHGGTQEMVRATNSTIFWY